MQLKHKIKTLLTKNVTDAVIAAKMASPLNRVSKTSKRWCPHYVFCGSKSVGVVDGDLVRHDLRVGVKVKATTDRLRSSC